MTSESSPTPGTEIHLLGNVHATRGEGTHREGPMHGAHLREQ